MSALLAVSVHHCSWYEQVDRAATTRVWSIIRLRENNLGHSRTGNCNIDTTGRYNHGHYIMGITITCLLDTASGSKVNVTFTYSLLTDFFNEVVKYYEVLRIIACQSAFDGFFHSVCSCIYVCPFCKVRCIVDDNLPVCEDATAGLMRIVGSAKSIRPQTSQYYCTAAK